MIDNKIVFDSVSEILDSKFIYKLGKEFCSTFEDKAMFIIKTHNNVEETKIIDNKVVTVTKRYDNVYHMTVFKCANGYIGTIDGHMASSYDGHEIYEIAKLSV